MFFYFLQRMDSLHVQIKKPARDSKGEFVLTTNCVKDNQE